MRSWAATFQKDRDPSGLNQTPHARRNLMEQAIIPSVCLNSYSSLGHSRSSWCCCHYSRVFSSATTRVSSAMGVIIFVGVHHVLLFALLLAFATSNSFSWTASSQYSCCSGDVVQSAQFHYLHSLWFNRCIRYMNELPTIYMAWSTTLGENESLLQLSPSKLFLNPI
jgi:hypothetical protein